MPWAPYDRCLARLEPGERHQTLGALSPGDAVDCRGVPFTRELLDELKTAVDNTKVHATGTKAVRVSPVGHHQ